MPSPHVALACILALAALPACSIHAGGKEDPAKVADQLRTQLAESQAQLAQRDQQIAELTKKLEKEQATVLTPDESAALPTIASVAIDARSGIARSEREFEVLVQTTDGRGRFMQVAGSLVVTARAVGAPANDAPLYTKQFGPLAVRDAYRSGFMGTHYIIDVPLTDAIKAAYESQGLDVVVELTQVTNDQVLTTSRVLKK